MGLTSSRSILLIVAFDDAGAFGQIRQRPAARVPLQPKAARDAGAGVVHQNRHMSCLVDGTSASKGRRTEGVSSSEG